MSWAAAARRQARAVTRAQLRADALTDDQIDQLLSSGALTRYANVVFVVRGAPDTREAREWTAVVATGGIAGFDTAAFRWGQLVAAPARTHVVVPHARRVTIPAGVRVYRVPVRRSGTPAWLVHDHRPRTAAGGLPGTDR